MDRLAVLIHFTPTCGARNGARKKALDGRIAAVKYQA